MWPFPRLWPWLWWGGAVSLNSWLPLPVVWWPDIAQALTSSGQPWPRAAACADLRYHADQLRMKRARRIPGRRTLARRWGWSDWEVRSLMRDVGAWQDSAYPVDSPAPLPVPSRLPPETETKTEDQTDGASRLPPAPLPVPSTCADLHTYTNTQIELVSTPTPTPSPKAPRVPSRFRDVAEVLAVPLPVEVADKPGLWAVYEAFVRMRAAGKHPIKTRQTLNGIHNRITRGYAAGHDVIWALEEATINEYRAFYPKAPRDPVSRSAPSAWPEVKQALAAWGATPPGGSWGFSDDPEVEASYHRGICAAAKNDDLRLAWGILFGTIHKGENEKWFKIRFDRAHTHTRTHTA